MNQVITSLIVLNYNTKNFMAELLPTLMRQTYPKNKMEIIVADNGSKDGSADYIAKNFPSVRLLRFPKNYGVADGFNRCVAKARGKYLIFVNSDTMIPPKVISLLVKKAEDTGAAIVYSLDYRPGTDLSKTTLRKADTLNIILGNSPDVIDDYDDVAFANFVCPVVNRDAVKLPLFDSEYFAYGEDLYLGFRVKLQGKKIVYGGPQTNIWHHGAGTASKNPGIAFFSERNRLINILTFFEWGTIAKISPLILSDLVLRLLYYAFVRRPRFVPLLRAVKWVSTNWDKIMRKRRSIQKERLFGDEELLKRLSYRLYGNQRIYNSKAVANMLTVVDRFMFLYCWLLGIKTYEFYRRG